MATTKTSFYADARNQYALKIATAQIVVAATWLRTHGCIFTTFSDRRSGMTRFYIKHCPEQVVRALIKKHGFFNADAIRKTAATKSAPAPRTIGKGEISREEWLSRFRYDSKAVAQPKARKIRNADELPADAAAKKPIEVVVPQLAVESNLYNKETINGMVVVTGSYTCRTVQCTENGFIQAEPLTNRPQTNSDLSGGVAHQTATIAQTEIALMPGCATAEQLMSCTLNQLYKFASTHNIKGRSSLKGERNKAALVEKLLGLVKKSDLK